MKNVKYMLKKNIQIMNKGRRCNQLKIRGKMIENTWSNVIITIVGEIKSHFTKIAGLTHTHNQLESLGI